LLNASSVPVLCIDIHVDLIKIIPINNYIFGVV